MAASMATTSRISKAILLPSYDAVAPTSKFPSSSLKFPFKATVGRYMGKMGMSKRGRLMEVVAMSSPPPAGGKIEDVLEKSIQNATELCAADETSGECAAAWDEVEEVSAAASDIRVKQKSADPLETYCEDNPESDECRTYDN